MNASLEKGLRMFIDSMLEDVLETLKQDHNFEEKYSWMIKYIQIFEGLTAEEGEEPLILTSELKKQLHKLIEIEWEMGSVINRAAYGQGLYDGIQTVSFIEKNK